jgi:cell wall-associated NlpC family hydrolase
VPFVVPARVARRRPARLVAILAAGVATATVVGLLPTSAAFGAGATTTAAALAKAQQQADALGIQADKAVEAYDEAQNALAAAAVAQTRAQAQVAKAQAQLDVAKGGIQALAAAEYKSGTNSRSLVVLLSADPATVLSEADLLAQVSRYDEANVTKVINADRTVLSAQAGADQAVAAHKADAAAVNAHKVAVQNVLTSQEVLISRLAALQKSQAVAAAAAAARLRESQLEASRSRARAAIGTLSTDGGTADGTTDTTGAAADPAPTAAPVAPVVPVAPAAPATPPSASGNVAAVLAYAYAQLGKPYRWGGAGPGSFDCSGLAMRAWAAGGVSLGHSTVSQQESGRRVSLSDLEPGDLVFWGSPAYHVGIYVGGGRILDAPHTGTVVQIQAIWGSPSSAVRL